MKKNNKRTLNGILLLDKPLGITSNRALQDVKWLFNAKKAGHTGSLDPLATGLLPLCFGKATKLSQYVLNADKGYQVTMQLGKKTTTGDAEGDVVEEHDASNITDQQLAEVVEQFTGDIEQTPSMFSALKHNGVPLYKLAREGKTVERKSRTVTIKKMEITGREGDFVHLDVLCTKGTYIRTLVEDMGDTLKCCAYVSALRRYLAGPYQGKMVTLDELRALKTEEDKPDHTKLDRYLMPLDTAISDLPKVSVNAALSHYIKQGQAINITNAPLDGMVAIYLNETTFMGIGEVMDDGKVAPRQMV